MPGPDRPLPTLPGEGGLRGLVGGHQLTDAQFESLFQKSPSSKDLKYIFGNLDLGKIRKLLSWYKTNAFSIELEMVGLRGEDVVSSVGGGRESYRDALSLDRKISDIKGEKNVQLISNVICYVSRVDRMTSSGESIRVASPLFLTLPLPLAHLG